MNVMSLIQEVYNKQYPSLMDKPRDLKKLTLSGLVYDLLMKGSDFVPLEITNGEGIKILGLDVEVIDSNDIFISISLK